MRASAFAKAHPSQAPLALTPALSQREREQDGDMARDRETRRTRVEFFSADAVLLMALESTSSPRCPLSLWERARVRASAFAKAHPSQAPLALTPALSQRERGQDGDMGQDGAMQQHREQLQTP